MILGTHHIAIIVSSEASIEFYSRLGFCETWRKDRGYDVVVLMEGNGIELEIFISPTHPARATEPETMGVRHFALKVSNIEEATQQFKCGPIMKDWQGERFCFTWDPDGLPIELHE